MSYSSPPGMKNNRSSLLSLENNYRHTNGGAKRLTIKNASICLNSNKAPTKNIQRSGCSFFNATNGCENYSDGKKDNKACISACQGRYQNIRYRTVRLT